MSSIAVMGLQWGDEGKGKIVDFLAPRYDCVIRFQGGSNAGHTIAKNGKTYKLSLLPSGILHSNTMSIIASDVVIDPYLLEKEIKTLENQNIMVDSSRLMISEGCHLVLSLHKDLDAIYEKHNNIGTTVRGIGPCYEDKVSRRGIRICDLYDNDSLKQKINKLVIHHNIIRKGSGHSLLTEEGVMDEIIAFKLFILSYAKKVNIIQEFAFNKKLLFEGAQGALLDINHGTYPFVTSSCTTSTVSSALKHPKKILGVIKAYSTRVGNGPFITEENNEIGHYLQSNGDEFGTVTNRSRRCGWFDAVAVKHAISITNATHLVMTKIDVMDGLGKIKICNNYLINGEECDFFPYRKDLQDVAIPKYVELPGWDKNTANISSYELLPENAKKYLKHVEEILGLPICIISTGKEDSATIVLDNQLYA